MARTVGGVRRPACAGESERMNTFVKILIVVVVVAVGALLLKSPAPADGKGAQGGWRSRLASLVPSKENLTKQIDAMRQDISEREAAIQKQEQALHAEYHALAERRKNLPVGDAQAVAAFNSDANAYKTRTSAMTAAGADLAAVRRELDGLLAKRTKTVRSNPTPPPMDPPNKMVSYTPKPSGTIIIARDVNPCPIPVTKPKG